MGNIKVPYLDLKAQYQSIKPEIDAAIARVLESCQFVLGPEVAGFEQEFARYCGAAECIALNSGTSALHLALLAAGVGAGDEVITVPFTFVASVAAVIYTGARPVLVDIDPQSFTEDAAQAHGAKYKGRPAGSIGDMACFSFYPGKNLGAYGEGGAVTTSNAEYARTIRMLRDWGQDLKYHHVLRGYNYRMEGFQGAILRVKLRHLEAWTEARRTIVSHYNELLVDSGVETPTEMPWARHVYHVYTLRIEDRDGLHAALQAEGIQTGIHYPVPAHLQPAYADLGYGKGAFPRAEAAAEQVLSLPLYPELSSQAVTEVAGEVKKAVAHRTQTAVSR